MKKSQIIILVVAIITVIFLFTLPKHIVKDGRQTEVQSGKMSQSADSSSDSKDAHEVKLSEADQKNVDRLRKSYFGVSDKKKKLNFADSLARLFKTLNKFDSSAKYVEVIAALNPANNNWIAAGDAYLEASTYSIDQSKGNSLALKARSIFEQVQEKDPNNLDVKARVAKTYMMVPDPQNPMKGTLMLREVVKKDPKHPDALLTLGRYSIEIGKFDNAVERLSSLLEVQPENSEAWLLLGFAHMQLKEKDKAKECYEKAKRFSNDKDFQLMVDDYLKELNK